MEREEKNEVNNSPTVRWTVLVIIARVYPH